VLGKPIVLVTADHQNKAISKYRADYYKLMAETSGTESYLPLSEKPVSAGCEEIGLRVDLPGETGKIASGTLHPAIAILLDRIHKSSLSPERIRSTIRASFMKADRAEELRIETGKAEAVSALLLRSDDARACFVFAHGAGAGMTHSFMAAFAAGLNERRIASLRYQFPYMEKRGKRPDPPAVAQAAVRAAVAEAGRLCPKLTLVAGGKSFGGRMTSQAQAMAPLPGVRGLAFLGFPLHPAGKPSTDRGAHLSEIDIPMLFLQGTRDSLAEIGLIEPAVSRLPSATLHLVDGADHSFHVLARSGRNDGEAMREILDAFASWVDTI
jgi:predicted alpha/beta-hydrolase family hydrolase